MTQLGDRILIVGSPGSGKSTLARQLGNYTGLPVIHLDKEYWSAGWVEMPRELWASRVEKLVSGDRWIIDGNFAGTLEMRLGRAHSAIFLDIPRAICLWSAINRWIHFTGRTRPDMAPGCLEKMDWAFLAWIWNFSANHHSQTMEMIRRSGKSFIRLKSRKEIAEFLDQAKNSPSL